MRSTGKKRIILKAFNIILSIIIFISTLTIPTITANAAVDTSKRPVMSNLRAVPYSGVGLNGTTEYNGVMLTWEWGTNRPSWCEVVVTDYDLGFDYSGTQYDPNNPTQKAHCYDLVNTLPIVDRNSLTYNDPFAYQAFIAEGVTKIKRSYEGAVFENTPGKTYYFYILAYQSATLSGNSGGTWYIVDCIQYTRPKYLGIIPNGMQNDLKFSFANHQNIAPAKGTLMGRIQRFDTAKALDSWAPSVSWRIYSNGDGTFYADKKILNYNWSNGYPLDANRQEVHSSTNGVAAVINPNDPSVYCTVDNTAESYCIMTDTDVYEYAASGERSYYRYVFISESVHAETLPTASEYVDVGPQVSIQSQVLPTGTTAGQTGSVTFNINKYPKDTTGRFRYDVDGFMTRYRWTVIHITSTDVNDCPEKFTTNDDGYVDSGIHSDPGECGDVYHPYSLKTKTAVLGGYHANVGDANVPVYDAVTGAKLTNDNGSLMFNVQDTTNITFHFASLYPYTDPTNTVENPMYQKIALNTKLGITADEDGSTYNRHYLNNNILVPGKTYVFKFVSCYEFDPAKGDVHPQTGQALTQKLNFFGTTEFVYTVPLNYSGIKGYDAATTDWVGVQNSTIKVEVSWTNMEFTFVKPNWDPTTHTYPAGSWVPSQENYGQITVKNTGANSITAGFTYTQANSDVGRIINGVFTYSGSAVTSVDVRGGGWAKTVQLNLQKVNNQEPQRNINGETAGTITVSINEMYSLITSKNPNRNQASTS